MGTNLNSLLQMTAPDAASGVVAAPVVAAPATPSAIDHILALSAPGNPQVPDKPIDHSGFFDGTLQAFGHNLMEPFKGIAQGVVHGISAGAEALAPGSDFAKNSQDVASRYDKELEAIQQQYDATKSDSPGSWAGAAAGVALPYTVGGLADGLAAVGRGVAAKVVPSLGKGAGKVAGAMAQGGAVGLTTPVTSGNYSQGLQSNVIDGAATSGTLHYLAHNAGPVAKGVGEIFTDIFPTAANATKKEIDNFINLAGDNLPSWLTKMQGASSPIPGYTPTTQEILQNADVNRLAASAKGANTAATLTQQEGNNAAIANALKAIIPSQAAVDAEALARRQISQNNIDSGLMHHRPTIPIGDLASSIQKSGTGMNTPAGATSANFLLDKLAHSIENVPIAGPLPQGNLIRDAATGRMTSTREIPPRTEIPSISPESLDALRKAMNNEGFGSGIMPKVIDMLGGDKFQQDYLNAYSSNFQLKNAQDLGNQLTTLLGKARTDQAGTEIPSLTGLVNTLRAGNKASPYALPQVVQDTGENVVQAMQNARASSTANGAAAHLPTPETALGKMLMGENYSGPTTGGKALAGVLGGVVGHLVPFEGLVGAGADLAGAGGGVHYLPKLAEAMKAQQATARSKLLLNPQEFAAAILARQAAKATPAQAFTVPSVMTNMAAKAAQ